MSARQWHEKDHAMPFRPDGKDSKTGIIYSGDVLTGRKSVGQALYEAAAEAKGKLPEFKSPVPSGGEPKKPAAPQAWTGRPDAIAGAILRALERRKG